jgi:hypothetical protein
MHNGGIGGVPYAGTGGVPYVGTGGAPYVGAGGRTPIEAGPPIPTWYVSTACDACMRSACSGPYNQCWADQVCTAAFGTFAACVAYDTFDVCISVLGNGTGGITVAADLANCMGSAACEVPCLPVR